MRGTAALADGVGGKTVGDGSLFCICYPLKYLTLEHCSNLCTHCHAGTGAGLSALGDSGSTKN